MISQKEEMRTGTESSGVVLHDTIERIYFYFIIFSQKEMGSEKHTADVVLPPGETMKFQEEVRTSEISSGCLWSSLILHTVILLSLYDGTHRHSADLILDIIIQT
jgi:hypothetical protein